MSQKEEPAPDDDEFLDWETRDENVPLWKHIIAGKCYEGFNLANSYLYNDIEICDYLVRLLCRCYGASWNVSHGHC